MTHDSLKVLVTGCAASGKNIGLLVKHTNPLD